MLHSRQPALAGVIAVLVLLFAACKSSTPPGGNGGGTSTGNGGTSSASGGPPPVCGLDCASLCAGQDTQNVCGNALCGGWDCDAACSKDPTAAWCCITPTGAITADPSSCNALGATQGAPCPDGPVRRRRRQPRLSLLLHRHLRRHRALLRRERRLLRRQLQRRGRRQRQRHRVQRPVRRWSERPHPLRLVLHRVPAGWTG